MSTPDPSVDTGRSYDLLDAIPNPVYVWRRSQDGVIRLVFANVAGHRETRGRIQQLMGVALRELYADDPEIVDTIVDTMRDGVARRVEHEYRLRSTGELRWFKTSYMRTVADEVIVENEDLTDRRFAEAQLEASEARFRGLFEQGLTPLALADVEGRMFKVNAAFAELLGYAEQDLLATSTSTLTHPDDVADAESRLRELVSGAKPEYRADQRFLRADGRIVQLDVRARLVRDAAGTPQYVLLQLQDVTARRHAEQVQREERARLAELLERAPAIICTLRAPDHVYEMANEECRRFIGRHDVVGRALADVMPEIAEQGLIRILDDVLASGQPFTAQAMAVPVRRAPDLPSVERYLNVVVLPIAEADGSRSSTFVHCVDVTELVEAVQSQERLAGELLASQERHDLVLEATQELISDWDVARNTIHYSDAIHTAFKHPAATVREDAEWWSEQVHPDDLAGVVESFSNAVNGGHEFWTGEYRFRRGDGSYATVLVRSHILRNTTGAPTRVIGSMVDVTERRRLEAQLRESQKMQAVGRLAGGVAHDFNNLLSAIIGYADLAMMDTSESSTVREEIDEIRKAAQRAAELTRQLLAVGRRQIRRPTHVDVDAVVHEAERLVTQLLGESVELTVRTDAAGAMVHMDPGELDQILLNLAVNARDAMPTGGKVTIETSCRDAVAPGGDAAPRRYVLLSVCDTGSGIDAATMPHIFEPFFTTKGEAGTGLGLSTVYGIVEQAGGHIDVDTTMDVGTCFRLHLPIATGPRPVRERQRPSPPASPQSATVLLAEDEGGVRVLARRILERAGFHVLDAPHGADALRVWERHAAEIDIVVTDVVMPEMGGRALAEALRAQRPELPVLFMSGYSDDETTRRGLADLRTAYLAKPFTAEALVNAVRETIKKSVNQ